MSKISDFTGRGSVTSPSVQKLGDVSGTIQLDVSSFKQIEARPIGPTTFNFTGLGSGGNRGKTNIVLKDGGTTDITWDTRLTFDADFDGIFTQPTKGIEYWNISNPTLNGSHAVSSSPTGVFFGNGGMVMYVSDSSIDAISQYNLSVPWDVTTVINSAVLDVSGDTAQPNEAQISNDGTKLYVMANDINSVITYILSTPWDVTTASLSNETLLLAVGTYTTLFFGDNGNKMYVGMVGGTVRQYTMSVPWDITTAVYDNVELNLTNEMANTHAVFFSPDGTILMACSNNSPLVPAGVGSVFHYNLSNPWDISTATFSNKYGQLPNEGAPLGIFFTPIGDKMFIAGNQTDSVREYDTALASLGPWDIAFSEIQYTTGNVLRPDQVGGCAGLAFSPDGTFVYTISNVENLVLQHSLDVPWDIKTAIFENSKGVTAANLLHLKFTPDGTSFYFCDVTNSVVRRYSSNTAWEIETFSASSDVFDFSAEVGGVPFGLHFSADGSKMFILSDLESVHQYNLSTPWTISSATHAGSFDASGQISDGRSIAFSDDGTIMIVGNVSGASTNTQVILHRYTLSLAWDVTTASYDNIMFDCSTTGTEFESGNNRGHFTFRADGIVFYTFDTSFNVAQFDINQQSAKVDIIQTEQYANNHMMGRIIHTYGNI